MIEKYLTKDRIRLKIRVVDWKDLVDQVGKIMLDLGDIEPGYINAMKRIIEELGPYAVIAPGVVLLHARPEEGVRKISLVMVTLEEGVYFGSKNDPVKLAIGLGATDHVSHIELLRDVSLFLQNKEILSKIYSFNNDETDLFIEHIKESSNKNVEKSLSG